MENQLIWAYFLQLSDHMWDDENTPARFWYVPPRYVPENNTDLETWDTMVQFIAQRKYNALVIDVGDDILYDSHPEISAPDAWSKDFLKKKLDELRALGITPIPKLNFSACHHTWLKEYRRMLSTPTYYRVCSDVIAEVCEVFGYPKLFHLGMDEEGWETQRFREQIHVRGEKLYWHDVYFLFDEVAKHGARPWVWSDYYRDHPDLFVKYMPKSVLQSNYCYRIFRDTTEPGTMPRINAYKSLNELGYDQLPCCSSYTDNINPYQTCMFCKENLDPALLKGYLTVPWSPTTKDQLYYLQNDAHNLYVGRQKAYPETL